MEKPTNQQDVGTSSSERFVRVRDIARHLDISEPTAYEWAQPGVIPSIKLGRSLRFRLSDIERALAERTLNKL